MVEEIVQFGRLDPDEYDQIEDLKDFVVETANQYGFSVVNREGMEHPGIIADNGDYIEIDPDFIERSALTYLDPELMKRKIETRIQTLRGKYEDDHFGLKEEAERKVQSDEITARMSDLQDRMRKNIYEAEETETLSEEGAKRRNRELREELDSLDERLELFLQPRKAQANLYMVNEQASQGNDPVEAIAVSSYNPFMYSRERNELEGFFDEHFSEYPWLDPDSREEVVDFVIDINQRLEEKAEELKG